MKADVTAALVEETQFNELDVGLQFLLLAQVAVRHEGRALQSLSLSYRQMRTLRHVRHGVTSATELGRIFGVTAPAISETVETLVKKGMLERAPHDRDRRSVKLVLTAAGTEIVDEAERVRRKLADDLLAPLSATQRTALETIVEPMYRLAYERLLDQRLTSGDEGSP